MSERIVLSEQEPEALVLRLFCEETTSRQLAREAGISDPTLYQSGDAFFKRLIFQFRHTSRNRFRATATGIRASKG